jgi:hypothetical protein
VALPQEPTTAAEGADAGTGSAPTLVVLGAAGLVILSDVIVATAVSVLFLGSLALFSVGAHGH